MSSAAQTEFLQPMHLLGPAENLHDLGGLTTPQVLKGNQLVGGVSFHRWDCYCI